MTAFDGQDLHPEEDEKSQMGASSDEGDSSNSLLSKKLG
jgi:hypothetical protein